MKIARSVMLLVGALFASTTSATAATTTAVTSRVHAGARSFKRSPNTKDVLSIHVANLFGTRDEPPVGEPIAFGAGSTWVIGEKGVVRINSTTGRIVQTIPVEGSVENLAFANGHLWAESVVIGTNGYQLSEITPATNSVVKRTVIDPAQTQEGFAGSYQTLAAVGGFLYLETNKSLFRIDPSAGTTITSTSSSPLFERVNGTDEIIQLNGALGTNNIACATIVDSHIWATSVITVKAPTKTAFGQIAWQLNEYDNSSGAKLSVSVPNIWLVAAGAGQLWGIQQKIGTDVHPALLEINPSNGRMERKIEFPAENGPNPVVAVGSGVVWLEEVKADRLLRVAT